MQLVIVIVNAGCAGDFVIMNARRGLGEPASPDFLIVIVIDHGPDPRRSRFTITIPERSEDDVQQLVARLEASPSISRIWATCALDNPASARVLEKSGFHREAILKKWVTYPAQGGLAFDNYSYVRLPSVHG